LYESEFPFHINNLCHAWSHFVENVVGEEYDVKPWSYKEYDQLKMEEFKEDYCKKL
jgi:hypothetical protein